MPLTVAYAIALAEARSCLAALADSATSFDQSVRFEHLLVGLDALHGDECPALRPPAGDTGGLLQRLEAAGDQMVELGGDSLSVEILLDQALIR